MMLTQENYDTLQWMFISKYMQMLATKFIKLTGTGLTDTPKPSPLWDSYLDENGIGRMSGTPVAEGWPAGYIILINPACGMEYIFVPKEFAEKALILGFLP